MATVGVSLPVPAGTGDGAAQATANMAGKKTILVSGVFTGQLLVQIRAIAGGPWCTLRTFSAPKSEVFEVACAEMRVSSQAVGGAPIVDVSAEEAVVEAVNLAVPAGNGSGAASDISALGELTTAFVSTYGGGSCIIELSEDGVNWVQGFSTFTPAGGCQTKKTPANFARVTRAGASGAAPVVQLAATTGAGGGAIAIAEPRTCFVFRPNGVAVENVYTDFAALMAAVNSVEGCKEIMFDDSLLSPAVIPAGAWDMTGVTWSGFGQPADAVTVQISDGATITNLIRITKNLFVQSASLAPVFSIPNGDEIILNRASLFSLAGASPLIEAPAGATSRIVIEDDGGLFNVAGVRAVTVGAGATMQVVCDNDNAQVQTDTFEGAGDVDFIRRSDNALVETAQPNVGGNVTLAQTYGEDTFVFQPGGTAEGNVYTDFAALMGAVGSIPGRKTIVFDPRGGGLLEIPAGAWDFSGLVLRGLNRSFEAQVTIADGATISILPAGGWNGASFNAPALQIENMVFTSNSLATVIAYDNVGIAAVIRLIDATLRSANVPMIDVIDGDFTIELFRSTLDDALGAAIADLTGGTLTISMFDDSRLDDGALAAVPTSIDIHSPSALIDPGIGALLPAFGPFVAFQTPRYFVVDQTAVTPQTGVLGRMHRFDTSGGDKVVDLPPSGPGKGGRIAIKKETGDANNIIGNPAGADAIVGPDRTATAFGFIEFIDNGDGTWSTATVL